MSLETSGNSSNPGGNANLQIGKTAAAQESGVPGGKANLLIGKTEPWHSRGYLPHYEDNAKIQHVTFHLADSLAEEVLEQLMQELAALPTEKRNIEHRKRCELWIDQGHGSCILQNPKIGQMVESALLFFDAQRYHLFAWTIMPNHVHVLFQPIAQWTVAKIVASWKKFTARQIGDYQKQFIPQAAAPTSDVPASVLKPVWHREYWDRYMRNERHLQQTLEYIHQNPVKAGLVHNAEEWPWGSARFQTGRNKR